MNLDEVKTRMSAVRIYGREILSDFIRLYRENECLWNTKSKYYQNKSMRQRSYNVLLKKLREAEKTATLQTVKIKINSMRTNFRHELRKIEESKQMAAAGSDVYQPTLWYFNDLTFLLGGAFSDIKVKDDKINSLTDLRSCPRNFIREFIQLYKEHECLWNNEVEVYKNKYIKEKAYEVLRVKCLEIDKNATTELVKKKINSIRTNFFAYYKKIQRSRNLQQKDDFFQPKLYYYDDLKFLLGKNADNTLNESVEDNKMTRRSETPDENKTSQSDDSCEENHMRSESPEIDKTGSMELTEEDRRSESKSPVEYKLFENVEIEDYFLPVQNSDDLDSPEKPNTDNDQYSQQQSRKHNDILYENENSFEQVSSNLIKKGTKQNQLINKSNTKSSNVQRQKRLREQLVSEDDSEDYQENLNRKKTNQINSIQKYNSQTHNIENNAHRQKRIRKYSDSDDENENVSKNLGKSKCSTKILKFRPKFEESQDDEFDIYAKYIASEIRTLSPEDLIFVKKLLNDTLFEAKLGNAKCMRIMSNSKLQMTSEDTF